MVCRNEKRNTLRRFWYAGSVESLDMSREIVQVEQRVRQKAPIQLTVSPSLLTAINSFELCHPYGMLVIP